MEHVKSRIRNMLNYRRPTMWIAVVILLLLLVASIDLLSDRENKSVDAPPVEPEYQEMSSMAAIWAEALKTRDGEPRFEIMSEKLRGEFIEGQKQRNDPWNFNIGVSSPWVTDYTITVKEASAEILYHMTDSTQGKYDKREIIYFGKENGKTVVIDAEELLSDWERYYYYAPTADGAMQTYTQALLTSDYSTMLSLTPSASLEPNGQQIWDTVTISDVEVVTMDVRDQKACYGLELSIEDGGNSAFEKGVFPRWLWLVKGDLGWYVEGLMTGGVPDSGWWSSDVIGGTEIDIFEFDELLYLSPLSSSTFDYAENRMKDTKVTFYSELFKIDYSNEDDYEILQPKYTEEEMTDDMIRAFGKSTMEKVSISEYKAKYRYTIFTNDNQKTNFCFYVMDGQLWLSSYADNTADKSEITMYIWKLK